MNAKEIVDALIESEDPKDFLARNSDLDLDRAFVAQGWAIRSDGTYGKMNSDDDVRWIVQVYEHNGVWRAVFSGEKLMDPEKRTWEDFDIDGEIELKPDQDVTDFILEIEDYLCDKTGPEYDPEQAAADEYWSRADDAEDNDYF